MEVSKEFMISVIEKASKDIGSKWEYSEKIDKEDYVLEAMVRSEEEVRFAQERHLGHYEVNNSVLGENIWEFNMRCVRADLMASILTYGLEAATEGYKEIGVIPKKQNPNGDE